jgi:ParB-like chromosome segregation protein Spo0J
MSEIQFHPVADLFPLMEGEEFDALVEDIKKNGQQTPIVLYDSMILDGRNRHRACIKLGIAPRFADKVYSDRIKDATAYVISANVHRRHLNTKQKCELIAKLLKAQPEKSNRTIAKQAKVDKGTVAKIRKAKEATGEIRQLKKTIGSDGKARPAKKAKPAARAGEAKTDRAAAPPPPEPTAPAPAQPATTATADIDPLKEELQAARIKIAGLESEVEELKAENADLRARLAAWTELAPLKADEAAQPGDGRDAGPFLEILKKQTAS